MANIVPHYLFIFEFNEVGLNLLISTRRTYTPILRSFLIRLRFEGYERKDKAL